MASRKNQSPNARKKDDIHFVNARPSSETERLKAQRLVRAHVGRWISDQTKDRAEPSSRLRSPGRPARDSITQSGTSDCAGPSSYTLVSRPSPHASQNRAPNSNGMDHGLVLSFAEPPEGAWQRSPFPPSHTSDSSESSDEAVSPSHHGHSPAAFVPWHEISRVEPQVSGMLDPFGTCPIQLAPEVVNMCKNYCSFYVRFLYCDRIRIG